MSISKISRRIVVAIFVAMMILILGMETYYTFNSLETLNNNMFSKFIYVIALIALFTTYATIKNRFSRKRLKKSVSLTYRFIFLILTTLGIKLFILMNTVDNIDNVFLLIISTIMVISSLVVKKIIYNVSKSDMLSVLGLYMYALLPNIINDKILMLKMSLTVFNILLIVMIFQKIVDELKQLNLKTHKYVRLSILLGVLIGISMLFNVNSLIYIFMSIVILCIIENLDKIHLNYSKKVLNKKKKDIMYRMQLIHINKMIISFIIISLVAYIMYIGSIYVIRLVNVDCINQLFMPEIRNNVMFNILKFKEVSNVKSNFMNVVSYSRGYYIVAIIYILIIEVITMFLRRRYDTKSTTLKALFIFMVLINTLFGCEFVIFSNVYTVFLILIAITNTSNIYLNRDERIKLLN